MHTVCQSTPHDLPRSKIKLYVEQGNVMDKDTVHRSPNTVRYVSALCRQYAR